MKISNIFFGAPTDGFFRRYAIVLLMFSYLAYAFITHQPGQKVSTLESFFFTTSLFLGPFFWLTVIGSKQAYGFLAKEYPNFDLSQFSTIDILHRGNLLKMRPDLNVLSLSTKEVKAYAKEARLAKKAAKKANGFMAGFKGAIDQSPSVGGGGPSKTGLDLSREANLDKLRFEIDMYQKKYDDAMRTSSPSEHKHAQDVLLPLINEKKAQLK